MTRVLVVDNYDSFVFTLVDYLRQHGAEAVVVRNDQVPGAALDELSEAVRWPDLSTAAGRAPAAPATQALVGYDAVLISPGPGAPHDAGASLAVIAESAARAVPLLGVCLGHQGLAEAYGATVAHAPQLRHGKTSAVDHDGSGVFAGLANPMTATRYHSLAVVEPTLSPQLRVTARADGVIMGLAHRTLPLHGVQFHPESILTEGGHDMIANWLALAA